MASSGTVRTRPTQARPAQIPALLEAMLDVMPALAALARDDGTIAYVNDPLVRLCGWNADAARGRTITDLLPTDEAARIAGIKTPTTFRAVLATTPPRNTMIEWTARPLTSEGGDVFVCLAGRDITRETDLESFIIQNQWFETAAALSGGLAHDFNNVLAAILGLSEIMSLRLSPDHALQEFTKKIGISIDRAKTLVRRFSQFSRKNAGGAEPQATAMVLDDLTKLLRGFMPGSVTLSTDFSPDTPWFEADRYVIEQIVLNCANFLRARLRADTGTMKLSCRPTADCKRAIIDLQGSGQGLLGVDVESFFALDLRPTSTAYESGTGLYVARALATRQEAQLRLVRHDPRTFSFVLELPPAS